MTKVSQPRALTKKQADDNGVQRGLTGEIDDAGDVGEIWRATQAATNNYAFKFRPCLQSIYKAFKI